MKPLRLLALLVMSAATASAQDSYVEASPLNVAVAVRAGATMATPRGDFPSLIIGESKRSTGSIGQEFGESRAGMRLEVAALVPFNESIGLSLAFGTSVLSIGYDADSMRHPTTLDVQTLQGSIGAQWSILNEPISYQHPGLRSVYVDGGLDVGLATIANRVESTSYDDSLGTMRSAADGSFTSNEPFRNVVALRGAVGLRFAASPSVEIIAESWYSYALNPLFSSEAIEDNDLAVDVLGAVIGIGWRF
jgi:hypothetical protein